MRPVAIFRAVAGLGIALCVAFQQPAFAQKQLDERPTISVETNLVVLPVTVVDKHVAVVSGLAAEQFTVFDNGQRQPIDLFTNEDIPATVGLVIDSSSSMRGRRAEVTAAATAFAASSHPLDELFTINFNEHVWPGLSRPFAYASEFQQLQAALAEAPARGMTALYDAVARALEHLRRGSRDRKILIVVSDGGDNASSHTLEDVMSAARQTNAVIYGVILSDPDDRGAKPGVLKAFARETGGTAFTPKDPQDVMATFSQIAREIRASYTIGFSLSTTARDGFHTIRVAVNDPADRRRLTAQTRRGYYAPKAGGVK
jgi:VWFA-related protein